MSYRKTIYLNLISSVKVLPLSEIKESTQKNLLLFQSTTINQTQKQKCLLIPKPTEDYFYSEFFCWIWIISFLSIFSLLGKLTYMRLRRKHFSMTPQALLDWDFKWTCSCCPTILTLMSPIIYYHKISISFKINSDIIIKLYRVSSSISTSLCSQILEASLKNPALSSRHP